DRGHGLVDRRRRVDLRVAARDGDQAQDEPLLQRFQPGSRITASTSGSVLFPGGTREKQFHQKSLLFSSRSRDQAMPDREDGRISVLLRPGNPPRFLSS